MKALIYVSALALLLPLHACGSNEKDTESEPTAEQWGAADENNASIDEQKTIEPNDTAIDVQLGFVYILVSDTNSEKECENLRNLSIIKKDETRCISNRDQWRRLCSSVYVKNGQSLIATEALTDIAGYMAVMGETNNSMDAVESVVKNNGAYGRKVYWEDSQKDTQKACKITFSAQGMFQGTTINENFSGYATEIGAQDDGTSLVIGARGGSD